MRQILYRLDQFRRARKENPSEAGLARAEMILSPELFNLFSRMLPFEQAHAIRVMDAVAAAGYDDCDMLSAALLHDAGKSLYPLNRWERGLAVLVKALLPGMFQKWGNGEPAGLRAGIVVATQHAAWGAELAAEAGANERIVWFIRHHDTDLSKVSRSDSSLLGELQKADAAS